MAENRVNVFIMADQVYTIQYVYSVVLCVVHVPVPVPVYALCVCVCVVTDSQCSERQANESTNTHSNVQTSIGFMNIQQYSVETFASVKTVRFSPTKFIIRQKQ